MNLECETLAVQGREHYFGVDSQYNIPLQWNFWGKNVAICWFMVFLSIEIRGIEKDWGREMCIVCLLDSLNFILKMKSKFDLIKGFTYCNDEHQYGSHYHISSSLQSIILTCSK